MFIPHRWVRWILIPCVAHWHVVTMIFYWVRVHSVRFVRIYYPVKSMTSMKLRVIIRCSFGFRFLFFFGLCKYEQCVLRERENNQYEKIVVEKKICLFGSYSRFKKKENLSKWIHPKLKRKISNHRLAKKCWINIGLKLNMKSTILIL